MTNREIMEIFKERYGLEVDDIRPLASNYLDGVGIVIYLKNGDKIAYFPDMRGGEKINGKV